MIIFSKETLREALRGLRVLKLSKQILPVHQRVLVFGYEDTVEFTGTNLDQYLRYSGLGMSSAAIRILVPFDTLSEVAKNADALSEVQIEPGEKPLVRYHASGAVLELPFAYLDIAEYPSIPEARGEPIPLPAGVLTAMSEALTCASSDTSRYILNSVYLDAHAVVATDGRQLYRRNSLDLPMPQGAIIPSSPVPSLLPHDLSADLCLWTEHERPYAQITTGSWHWITKLVEGNFPQYQQVIPQLENYPGHVRISDADAHRIISVAPKLPGFKDRDSKVVLSVSTSGATLRTPAGLPKVQLALDRSEVVSPSTDEVAFNSRYLISALQMGLRELRTRDAVSPLMMTDGNRIHLWMPLREAKPTDAPSATPSDPSAETPTPVVPTSEPQPTHENTTPSTTMVASNNATPGTDNGTRSTRTSTAPVQPGTVVDAVNTHLNRLRDLLREANGELGNIQTLVKEQQRSHKALERDHESLKKNIRALREVPV